MGAHGVHKQQLMHRRRVGADVRADPCKFPAAAGSIADSMVTNDMRCPPSQTLLKPRFQATSRFGWVLGIRGAVSALIAPNVDDADGRVEMSPHLLSSLRTSAAESERSLNGHAVNIARPSRASASPTTSWYRRALKPTTTIPGAQHLIGRGWSINRQRRAVGQGVSAVAGFLVADLARDDDLARYPLPLVFGRGRSLETHSRPPSAAIPPAGYPAPISWPSTARCTPWCIASTRSAPP